MGLLDRLLRRTEYEVLENLYKQSLSEKIETETRVAELEQDLRDSKAELFSVADRHKADMKTLRNDKLFFVPTGVRGNLFKEMLLSEEKNFAGVNGAGIYLADRHSTVYELVNTISVIGASFRGCNFDGAIFDNVLFRNVNFQDVTFNNTNFEEVSFDDCTFTHCEFDEVTGYDVRFTNCTSSESDNFHLDFPESEVDEETQADIDSYLYEVTHPEDDFEDDNEWDDAFDDEI